MSDCPYAFKKSRWSSHGTILRKLATASRQSSILDVGTATGYLGEQLHKKGFVRVDGVESVPAWADQASAHYEKIYRTDLEAAVWPWESQKYDFIICADILEHLKDPWAVLKRMRGCLAPGGTLIISLPNVAHWSMRLLLLCGRFRYSESGILDKDHLRFFTYASARALISQAGLKPIARSAVPLPVDRWSRSSWVGFLLRGVEIVDKVAASALPSVAAFQWVFFAQSSAE